MCDKAVDDNPNAIDLFPDKYKTQEICDCVI